MSETILKQNGEEDSSKTEALGEGCKVDRSIIRCRAYMTTAKSDIPSGVWIPTPMENIDFDTDNIHTSDPTLFKINTSGLYLIVHQNGIAQGNNNIGIRKNKTDFVSVENAAHFNNTSAFVYLAAGDIIEPMISQSTGNVASSYITDTYRPYITISKISD